MGDVSVMRNEKGAPTVLKKPLLVNALDQSQRVTTKVGECAKQLSSVNAVLKKEIAEDFPQDKVEQALHLSEVVEAKIEKCAEELFRVNQILEKELRERKNLERKLAERKIELSATQTELSQTRNLALHDVITGLPNRRLFADRLETALIQAQRREWRLAVMFIDFDKFKNINDSYGHDVGDKVLQMVSRRLQTSLRAADTVGRHGGDEFLFLMLEVKNQADVENVAGKIIDNISQLCAFDGLALTVKASIGIAVYPQDGKSAHVLIKNADSALYKAKQQSDKRYCFYN